MFQHLNTNTTVAAHRNSTSVRLYQHTLDIQEYGKVLFSFVLVGCSAVVVPLVLLHCGPPNKEAAPRVVLCCLLTKTSTLVRDAEALRELFLKSGEGLEGREPQGLA